MANPRIGSEEIELTGGCGLNRDWHKSDVGDEAGAITSVQVRIGMMLDEALKFYSTKPRTLDVKNMGDQKQIRAS